MSCARGEGFREEAGSVADLSLSLYLEAVLPMEEYFKPATGSSIYYWAEVLFQ